MQKPQYQKIGDETIARLVGAIRGHFNDYHLEIDRAYVLQGNELSMSISVKLQPGKKGGTDYEVGFNFVKDKIKARSHGNIDEKQMELFGGAK